MHKVLVAFDGSANSIRAVHYAVREARERIGGMQLELLHVLDPVTFHGPAAALTPEELTRLCPPEAERAFAPAQEILDQSGVVYQKRCRVGSPAAEIAAQVRESGCDTIIMGTRGLGPVANVMIGSVASRTVHIVDVPVVLIK